MGIATQAGAFSKMTINSTGSAVDKSEAVFWPDSTDRRAITYDGRFIIAILESGIIQVWDHSFSPPELLQTINTPLTLTPPRAIVYNGKQFYVNDGSNMHLISEDGDLLDTFSLPSGGHFGCGYDGKHLFVVHSTNATLLCIDPETGDNLWNFSTAATPRDVCFIGNHLWIYRNELSPLTNLRFLSQYDYDGDLKSNFTVPPATSSLSTADSLTHDGFYFYLSYGENSLSGP